MVSLSRDAITNGNNSERVRVAEEEREGEKERIKWTVDVPQYLHKRD